VFGRRTPSQSVARMRQIRVQIPKSEALALRSTD
jgi:hypothetical protein